MKKEVKCRCANVCVDCKHYSRDKDDIDNPTYYSSNCYCMKEYCLIRTKTHKNCVDGKETIEHVLCKDYNQNGQCKKFTSLPHAELKRIIKEYRDTTIYADPFARETVLSTLLTDLVKVLEGGEGKSGYFTSVNHGYSPSESEVIVTKSAILKSLEIRGYKLEEQKKGTLYGDYVKIKPDDYLKEKSWLERVKKALGK